MRDDECDKRLKELEERIEALEGLVNLAIEELRDIRALLEKRAGQPAGAAAEEKPGGHPILRMIAERKFVDLNEIKSRTALRRLLEKGAVIALRDEGANREVVTTKEVILELLNKLPLSVDEVEKLDEREYELLEILNRLGYVIKKDNKYVATDLAQEFRI